MIIKVLDLKTHSSKLISIYLSPISLSLYYIYRDYLWRWYLYYFNMQIVTNNLLLVKRLLIVVINNLLSIKYMLMIATNNHFGTMPSLIINYE